MKRWTLGVGCAGLLCFVGGALAAPPADVIDRTRLASLASKHPDRIFEDPQLSCYLRGLLSEKEYGYLREAMSQIALEREPDAAGAFHFAGGVRGLYTEMEGLVLVEPGGRLWVAYIDGGQVKYFTNDAGSFQKPPSAVDEWRERFKDKPVVAVSAQRKVQPEELARQCSPQKLGAELERFSRAESGSVCSPESTHFTAYAPRVVKGGSPEGRAYFFTEPEPCPASGECKSRKKAYLVENDAVEPSEDNLRKNGFVCVRYQGAKGAKTGGWMLETALTDKPLELPVAGTSPGAAPADWVGTWSQGSASLTIRTTGPNRIQVEVLPATEPGMADPESFQVAYTVSGPLLSKGEPVEKGDEPEPVKLRLFNNALYAECRSCGFDTLFYRKQGR